MGSIELPREVLRIAAVFTGQDAAHRWAYQTLTGTWGKTILESEPYEFTETDYYQSTMGERLIKRIYAFESAAAPDQLADWKRAANDWEADYLRTAGGTLARPLNIDPGYLTEAKLVLATTKDRDHRVYLRDGICAEVTLAWRQGQWRVNPWTYADYRREVVIEFLTRCRRYLRGLRTSHR